MHIRQLRSWLVRLAGIFGRDARDRELAEELESHIQMHIDDNLRAGLTPEEARRYFAGEDPVGKRLILYNTYAKSEPAPYEVIGIVGDIRHRGLNVPASPEFYVSYLQMPPPSMSLVVRLSQSDSSRLMDSVRGTIMEV